MSCYRPKKGFPIGFTENGKTKYKIVPFETDHLEFDGDKWNACTYPVYDGCVHPTRSEWIQIPCGKCIGCRLDYARNWTARIMCELQQWPAGECWFLTLTYNDENLPLVPGADHLGEAVLWPTLDPRDVTLFWKRLRKLIPAGMKFYLAAEYGSKTARPHYHAIVFGLELGPDRKEFYKFNEFHEAMYRSAWLEDIWQKGNVIVGSVTPRSAGYVARYCMKKIYDSVQDDYSNRVHEFVRMSRRPGIGKTYIENHLEIFDLADFSLPGSNGQKFTLPRYFLDILRQQDPGKWQELHDQRYNAAMTAYQNMLASSDLPYLAQLRNKELNKREKILALKRRL